MLTTGARLLVASRNPPSPAASNVRGSTIQKIRRRSDNCDEIESRGAKATLRYSCSPIAMGTMAARARFGPNSGTQTKVGEVVVTGIAAITVSSFDCLG